MDGFAVQSADLANGPVELDILEEVQAGGMPKATVGPGQAVAVYTGAPVPTGCDAVVMKERCEVLPGGKKVRANDPALKPGKSVMPKAAEIRAGDVVVPAGTILTPATFGLFATVGKTAVLAYPLPKVSVIATGNELVEPNTKPKGAQIRNSNGPMLMAQSVRAGALPRYIGSSPDDEVTLNSYLGEGLITSNIMVLAGGVSAGKFDLVPAVLESLGVKIHFHHVRMKPGKPLLFGTKDDVLVFGLPGNPVSAYVGFELFVRPAIRKLSGHGDSAVNLERLPLQEMLKSNNDRPTYVPALVEGNSVRALPWLGSADLRALLNANAFIVLPAGEVQYPAGHEVELLRV